MKQHDESTRIGEAVISFCEDHRQFHAEQLREAVSLTGSAPGSADRVLRDLRQRGFIDYRVLNRHNSLYEVIAVRRSNTVMEDSDKPLEKPIHPAALLFPMMNGEELKELAKDIKENGLREPILLYQDQILDGRNRDAACALAGVTPRYEDAQINGDSPTLLVVSKNLRRRHLSASERATIGANLLPMLEKEAQERMRKGGNTGRDHRYAGLGSSDPRPAYVGRATHIAGKAVGVSPSTIKRTAFVKRHNPALFEQIQSGKISASTAHLQVRQEQGLPPLSEQRKVAPSNQNRNPKGKAVNQRSRDYDYRRMVEGLSMIRGLCRGLGELRIPLLLDLPAQEKQTWARIASQIAQDLRNFAKKLRSGTDADSNSNSNDITKTE